LRQASIDLAALERLAEPYAAACSQELASLLSTAVDLGGAVVESVGADQAAAHPAPVVDLRCRTDEDPPLPLHIVVTRSDAVTLAGLQLGEDAGAIMPHREKPLEPGRLAAFEEVMKVAVAALGRLFEEEFGRSAIQGEAAAEIAEPGADPSWLGAEQLLRIRFDLSIGDFPRGHLEVLISDAEASAGGAGAGPIFVIDPSEEERKRVEALATQLARSVTGLDPNELLPDDRENLAKASAVVVAWDLGGRAGLELVESLVWDERTQGVPILMASEAPTRGMVLAALRAGARSFVHRPYDAAEVRRRAYGEIAETAATDGSGALEDVEHPSEGEGPAGEVG
jgi:CheY-like chemotaxis protein